MKNFRDINMAELARSQPALHDLLKNCSPCRVGELFPAPDGAINLKYDGSSLAAYNSPWEDAAQHLATVAQEDARGLAVFFGLGLGYGALLLLEKRPLLDKIVIFEPSIDHFCCALQAVDLRPLLRSAKVEFHVGKIDWQAFENSVKIIAGLDNTYLLHHIPSAQWQVELYKELTATAYPVLNKLNIAGATAVAFGETFINNRLENLTLANHSLVADVMMDVFKGRPAILVASGPSLTESLETLRKLQGHAVIITVDGALAPLLHAGIMPNFVSAIDIKEFSLEKVAPFLKEEWPFSLVCNYKVTPLIPKRLPARQVYYMKEDNPGEEWFARARRSFHNSPVMSSVAHMSLGFALLVGADPIIFVGQDLAYPSSETKHAEGVINAMPGETEGRYPARGVDGRDVMTDRALDEIRARLEDVILANPGKYINATQAGASIQGTEILSLEEAGKLFCSDSLDINGLIEAALKKKDPAPPEALPKALAQVLADIAQMETKIHSATQLIASVRDRLMALDQKKISGAGDIPPHIRSTVQEFTSLNDAVDAQIDLWVQMSELTFRHHSENDRRRLTNGEKKKSGDYLGWLYGELDRIAFTYDVRVAGLEMYREKLVPLCDFLKKEEKFLKKGLKKGTGKEKYLDFIDLQIQAGNFGPALKILKNIQKNWPDDGALLLRRGVVAINQFDFEKAEKCFEQALAASPSLGPQIQAIKAEAAAGWLSHIEKYGSTRPNFCRQWIIRTLALAAEDNQTIEKLYSLWQQELERLARLIEENDFTMAHRHLSSWEPAKGLIPSWHYAKAIFEERQGRLPEAIAELQAALELLPEEANWLALLARLFIRQGQCEDGINRLKQAVSLAPGTAALWEEIGEMLSSASDFLGAAKAYEQCYLALPDHVYLLEKMGESYLRARQPQAAVSAFEALLNKDPQNRMVHHFLDSAKKMAQLLTPKA